MNCKQGDLAIVVRSEAGNEGKIVRCLELVTDHLIHKDGSLGMFMGNPDGAKWKVNVAMNTKLNGVLAPQNSYFIFDAQLKPIRGDVTDQDVADTYSSCQESKHKVKA